MHLNLSPNSSVESTHSSVNNSLLDLCDSVWHNVLCYAGPAETPKILQVSKGLRSGLHNFSTVQLNEIQASGSHLLKNKNAGLSMLLIRFPYKNLQEIIELTKSTTDLDLLNFVAHVQHSEFTLRQALGSNPNAPAQLQMQLAQDPHYLVRISVIKNPNTHFATLELIFAGLENAKAKLAHEFPLISGSENKLQLEQEIKWTEQAFTQTPNSSAAMLERLATSLNSNVRLAVSMHANTSAKALGVLALDPDYRVRKAVAFNPNTPTDNRFKLANDVNPQVRAAALSISTDY